MKRVVLDTNCLVSALIFSRNKMRWLRALWQTQIILPLVCKDTVSELLRVLAYPKFKLTSEEQEMLLADFLPYAEVVTMTSLTESIPQCRDEQDQKFLTLAIQGNAEVLVTGDQDLLVLQAQIAKPLIMTLSQFSTWLEG